MSYFYANRIDKNGNTLLTSYANAKSAEKYGGADATINEDLYHAEFSDDMQKLVIGPRSRGPVARSYMKNNGDLDESGGQYVLYGKLQGTWQRTNFSFSSYGAGNTAMKALIPMFEAFVLVDEGSSEEKPRKPAAKPLDLSDL